jgi:glycerol-3-phosphate acyltransferase PlsX
MTVIALDAMGGDFAPRAPVEAAVWATRSPECSVILVGDREALEPELARHPLAVSRLAIHHTPQTLDMGDPPSALVRRKAEASIRICFELVRAGEAQAVVSAGSSGGTMVAGKLVLGTLAGIDRPAIATLLPRRHDTTVFLDSGANADCKPHYLLQFARMGALYARLVVGNAQPRVGLLSNGGEPGKGNELTRLAHDLLRREEPAFIGNVEPRDVFRGGADVVVCDGFTGNLVLKTAEAAAVQTPRLLRRFVAGSPLGQLGYWLLRGIFRELARRTDPRAIGGSLLLGLNGVGIVCHGAATARAIENAIGLAGRCVELRLVERIAAELARPLMESAGGAAVKAGG